MDDRTPDLQVNVFLSTSGIQVDFRIPERRLSASVVRSFKQTHPAEDLPAMTVDLQATILGAILGWRARY